MLETNKSDQNFAKLRNILNEDLQNDISLIQEKISELGNEDFTKKVLYKEIDKASINPENKIRKVVNDLVPVSLNKVIKEKPDTIINTLYPVIGDIVSKYVRESLKDAMEAINQKVENQLPINRISRTIRAKIRGMSEEELIFSEAQKVRVNAVMLVEKGSGLIIDNYFDPSFKKLNPDLFAGLLTALQSFGKDCVEENEAGSLDQLEYGESKVLIESCGSLFMAILVRGDITSKLLKRLRLVFSNIIKKHEKFLSNFNGHTESIPEKLTKSLKELVNNESVKVESKDNFKPIFFFVLALLLFAICSTFISNKRNTVLAKIKTHIIYRELPLEFKFRLMTPFSLEGLVVSNEVKKDLISFIDDSDIAYDKIFVDNAQSLKITNRLNAFKANISELKGVFINLSANENIKLKGAVDSIQRKASINNKIQDYFPRLKPDIVLRVDEDLFSSLIFFKNGVTKLNKTSQNKIIAFARKEQENLPFFNITSFSNSIGSTSTRAKILSKRNNLVKSLLLDQGIFEEQIKLNMVLNLEGVALKKKMMKEIGGSQMSFTMIERSASYH